MHFALIFCRENFHLFKFWSQFSFKFWPSDDFVVQYLFDSPGVQNINIIISVSMQTLCHLLRVSSLTTFLQFVCA